MSKYKIIASNKFKKQYKKASKRHLKLEKLNNIIRKLANGDELPDKNYDHQLKGSMSEFRECHIEPDWLLIYQIKDNELILFLYETGSHSDLFE